MNKLIEAAEAAIGALENFVDNKVDSGQNADGVQGIVDFLNVEVKDAKKTVNVGGHKVTEADLYRCVVDKIPKWQFANIVDEVRSDLDKG